VARFMKYLWYVYALIFLILIGLAVFSFFGGFSNDLIDPAM
jgi:hypothetical protein